MTRKNYWKNPKMWKKCEKNMQSYINIRSNLLLITINIHPYVDHDDRKINAQAFLIKY